MNLKLCDLYLALQQVDLLNHYLGKQKQKKYSQSSWWNPDEKFLLLQLLQQDDRFDKSWMLTAKMCSCLCRKSKILRLDIGSYVNFYLLSSKLLSSKLLSSKLLSLKLLSSKLLSSKLLSSKLFSSRSKLFSYTF